MLVLPMVMKKSAGVSISYLTLARDDTDLTTYDQAAFDGLTLGAAAADRHIIVGVFGRAATDRSITSVSVAGVAATLLVTAENTGSGSDFASLWIAAVPTGTTGDVIVVFSDVMLRCAVSLWRMIGGSATPHDTDTDLTLTTTDLSVSVDVPSGGSAIAAVFGASAGTVSCIWTGLTEDFDSGFVETVSNGMSGAHENTGAQSGLTITADLDAGIARGALAVATFAPA